METNPIRFKWSWTIAMNLRYYFFGYVRKLGEMIANQWEITNCVPQLNSHVIMIKGIGFS